MVVKKSFIKRRENSRTNLNYYVALEPKQFDKEQLNPVDGLLDALPRLRRKLARLRKYENAAQPFVTVRKAFVNYADAQVAYRHARQIEAFNLGVELGVIVGRTRPQKASKASGAPLHGAILGAALSATQVPAGRLLSLFAIAEALLGGTADVGALKQALHKFKAQRKTSTKPRSR